MPKPQEIATVIANGQSYNIWQAIEIERDFETGVSLMRMSVAETVENGGIPGWPSLRLAPGDKAQGYLGGMLAINGYVTVRQTYYDAKMHGVEITVTSRTQDIVSSEVDSNPGQYRGYTLQQIAAAVAGKVGVNFQLLGNPADANKPFPRVSEHPGETRFSLIERLCKMRNIHLRDDENGNLIGFSGGGAGSIAQLVEGQNIKSARIIMRDDDARNQVTTIGANIGGSSTGVWGDPARDVSATAVNPNFNRYRPLTMAAEQPGDAQDMALRADFEIANNLSTMLTAEITVQGWFMDDGSLWIQHLADSMTINSPMLVPTDTITLSLKGVTHRQTNETGSETLLRLCLPNALGNEVQITATSGDNSASAFPPAMNPATPN